MTKKLFLSAVTLIIAACIVLSFISIISAIMVGSQILKAPHQNNSSSVSQPEQTQNQQLPTIISSENLPADIAAQMNTIQQQVAEIRGLHPKQTIHRDMLTTQQLRQKVIDDLLAQYTQNDAKEDVITLSILGLLNPDFDLYNFYIDIYTEQIAGYYNPETKQMFVVQDTDFSGIERMIYAHEFTHMLQDQHYDLRGKLNINEDYCEDHSEYCLAVTALVEGDAVQTEQSWLLRYSTDEDRLDVQNFYQEYQSPVFDSAPAFMQEDFLFPYTRGYEFVASLYDLGGQETVNQAFSNPPQSSEQILHPDKYPWDLPSKVDIPNLSTILEEPWKEIERSVLGEWSTYLMLSFGKDAETQLPFAQARTAVEGWQGDSYAVYHHPQNKQSILIHRAQWETAEDKQQYWDSFLEYGKQRWGKYASSSDWITTWTTPSDGIITFIQNETETLWIIAPNTQLTEQILSLLPQFEKEYPHEL